MTHDAPQPTPPGALTDAALDLEMLDKIMARWQKGEATMESDFPFVLGFARGQASRVKALQAERDALRTENEAYKGLLKYWRGMIKGALPAAPDTEDK